MCCTYVVLFFSLHSSKAAAAAASRLLTTSKRFFFLSSLWRRLDDGRAGLHGESGRFANLACCFREHTRRLATRPFESYSARLEKEGLFLLLRNPCSNQLVNAACLRSPLLTCSMWFELSRRFKILYQIAKPWNFCFSIVSTHL